MDGGSFYVGSHTCHTCTEIFYIYFSFIHYDDIFLPVRSSLFPLS